VPGAATTYIVYSAVNSDNLQENLGVAEYSYYFVRERFRVMLQKRYDVIVVTDPERQVDAIYDELVRKGRDCVFLSFAPPHRTFLSVRCPTIPVFAWEYDTIPTETWDEDPRNDWRHVLGRLGRAITHSKYSADAVRSAMGEAFPVVSIPAPVWDACRETGSRPPDPKRCAQLNVHAAIIDSRSLAVASQLESKSFRSRLRVTIYHFVAWYREAIRDLLPAAAVRLLSATARSFQRLRLRGSKRRAWLLGNRSPPSVKDVASLDLEGIVYTSVFNPYDGRKNWSDIVTAFCSALGDRDDAVLVLKFLHHNGAFGMSMVSQLLTRLSPHKCRVVAVDGFLDDDTYRQLIAATTFAVNASLGEGQCLPLMEFMSCGKPAVAPRHTSMVDYVDQQVAFPVQWSLEPCCWPHDGRCAIRAHRCRIDWQSLVAAFGDSYEVARFQPDRYQQMSRLATERLKQHCSEQAVHERLGRFIGDTVLAKRQDERCLEAGMTCPIAM
jgi:glycosyltransferase involved in cell wall biosynthesis